jgi:hypothetical protein
VHAELPLAIFVGDHDPAHAQRLVFRLTFHLPQRGIFLADPHELRRPIAIGSANRVMQDIVGILLSVEFNHQFDVTLLKNALKGS